MSVKKKVFWISAFIILAAIVIVICVNYIAQGQSSDFDGTLVRLNYEFPRLI